MRRLLWAAIAALILPNAVMASPAGDRLPELLYAGEAQQNRAEFDEQCAMFHMDACFGLGVIDLIGAVEGLSQALYRHGATAPNLPAAALLFGVDTGPMPASTNPRPEPISYQQLRDILDAFVVMLDQAQASFETAAEGGGDYVLSIDPLRVRLDLDGDGAVGEGETLASLLGETVAPPQGKTKPGKPAPLGAIIGFDRADAYWFSGYTQVAATPADFLLAHDFSDLFHAFGHRIFPKAGLPMQDFSRGGTLILDPDSDTFIADLIAGIHTSQFPVADAARFKAIPDRLTNIIRLSRLNWDAIRAETDDNRELVPSPSQTSLVPNRDVTEAVVAAWMDTLDTLEEIIAGELLIPHWRFRQGISLKLYFDTATETDLVMLLAGQGALPYLTAGPVADADSFAAGNRVFGAAWPDFAMWFN